MRSVAEPSKGLVAQLCRFLQLFFDVIDLQDLFSVDEESLCF
jgi:hypothetical protein